MSDVPAWTKDSVVLRIPDFATVETLSPEWALGGATGKGVRVAVVDSGIDANHPQLGDCVDVDSAVDFGVDNEGSVVLTEGPHDDVFGHGTACAGIIHALAPEASITSVRVLGPGLRGKAAAFHAGLQWAVENEFDVINLSLGASKRDWALAFHEVCDRAYFGNSFIVTAANNIRRVSFPSLFSAVASVACNTSDDPLRFHYNPDPPTEFLARGIDVEVPWLNGDTTITTGNSFAAPHIAGFAALIKSKHPDLRPFLVKAALWASAANIRDKQAPIEAAERKGHQTSMVGRGTMTSLVAPVAALVEEFAPVSPDNAVAPMRTDPTTSTGLPVPDVPGGVDSPVKPVAVYPVADPAHPRQPVSSLQTPAISSELATAQAQLPNVELTGVVAQGSWGTVYEGRADGREVAVRAVDQTVLGDPALLERFVASVRAAARLESTHVLPIDDLIEGTKQVFLIMPRCPSNLAAQSLPMDVGDACVVGLSALAGLQQAHAEGLLHGDLNLRNTLIDATGRVVLSDVGLAAPLQNAKQTARFEPAVWARMAPEQILGQALGSYTDTYAVGSLLFELLTGGPVHPPASSFADLHARVSSGQGAPPLSSMFDNAAGPSVGAELCAVVDKALASEPARRFTSAVSFFEALAGASFTVLGTDYIEHSRFVLDLD